MSDPTAPLRTLVAAHRPQRARDGYPDHIRREVVRHARGRAGGGVSIAALARDAGLSAQTLRRWLGDDSGGFVPVLLHDDPRDVHRGLEPDDAHPHAHGRSNLTVLTPNGFRVEGLDIRMVAELLVVLR